MDASETSMCGGVAPRRRAAEGSEPVLVGRTTRLRPIRCRRVRRLEGVVESAGVQRPECRRVQRRRTCCRRERVTARDHCRDDGGPPREPRRRRRRCLATAKQPNRHWQAFCPPAASATGSVSGGTRRPARTTRTTRPEGRVVAVNPVVLGGPAPGCGMNPQPGRPAFRCVLPGQQGATDRLRRRPWSP